MKFYKISNLDENLFLSLIMTQLQLHFQQSLCKTPFTLRCIASCMQDAMHRSVNSAIE